MHRTLSHARTVRVVASTATLVMLAAGVSTGASAVAPLAASAAEIVADYVGQEPETLTGEASIGDILTVAPAEETEETLVVQDGERTSVVAAIEDVTIRAAAPRAPIAEQPMHAAPEMEEHEDHEQPFIPPHAERAPSRMPRMPRIEDLPMPVQAQVRAASREQARAGDVGGEGRNRLGNFMGDARQRLA